MPLALLRVGVEAYLPDRNRLTARMDHDEGIIGFTVRYAHGPLAPDTFVQELNVWRSRLRAAGLVGQSPARYGGYGYGNLSCRLPPWDAPPHLRRYLITASQTGGLEILDATHCAVVIETHAGRNELTTVGAGIPSSESLTHGTVYAECAELRWVMHVHSRELWQRAEALDIPTTNAAVPYGSPAMSKEVRRLFSATDALRRRLFSMGGHEDGLVAFGATAEEAAGALFDALEKARQIVCSGPGTHTVA